MKEEKNCSKKGGKRVGKDNEQVERSSRKRKAENAQEQKKRGTDNQF